VSNLATSLRVYFVQNPGQIGFGTRRGARRRRPQPEINERYELPTSPSRISDSSVFWIVWVLSRSSCRGVPQGVRRLAAVCKRTLTLSATLYENRTEPITVPLRAFKSGITMVVGQNLALGRAHADREVNVHVATFDQVHNVSGWAWSCRDSDKNSQRTSRVDH